MYLLINVRYMFWHSLRHPFITSQSHLLIVRLRYNGEVTEPEAMGGFIYNDLYLLKYIVS